jgi:hypothetical protein
MEASSASRSGGYLDTSRLSRGELIGMLSALVLFGSLFLPWFGTGDNQFSEIDGQRGDFTAWEIFSTLDWLLVAACSAPFILSWIVARAHKLTWAPGEVTMIVGITAFALILINGVILGKPGDTVDVEFRIGYFVAMLGALGICVGGFFRQAFYQRGRKPPGTL